MENLKTSLKQKLKGAKKIAVLGIGSELRGDDIAGMLVAEGLEKELSLLANPAPSSKILDSDKKIDPISLHHHSKPRPFTKGIEKLGKKELGKPLDFRRRCGVKIFFGATAPENLTGEIRKFSPTHLVIFDTIDIGKNAGEITLIDKNKIAGISFCTHRLPIKIMTDYLMQSINCETIIIGIQPKTLDFLSLPSDIIKYSVKNIIKTMQDVLIPSFC